MTPEFLIAVLGLRRILGETPFKVLKQDVAKALKMPTTLEKEAMLVLRQEPGEQRSPLQFSDLAWIKQRLSDLDNGAQMRTILPALAAADVDTSLGGQILDIIRYLQEAMPIQMSGGLVSEELPEVAFSDDARFLWVCRLIDNPLHLMHLLQTTQATGRDTATLTDVLPELLSEVRDAVVGTIIDNQPNLKLTRPVKMMLSVLLDLPVINSQTLAAYAKSEEPAQPMPEAQPSNAPSIAQSEGA